MRVTAWWLAWMMAGVAYAQDIHASGTRIKSQWLREWVMQAQPDKQSAGQPTLTSRSESKSADLPEVQRPSCQVRELGEPCPRGGVATLGSPFPMNDQGVGNPIDLRNGNKYQRETDLPDSGRYPGLELVRHYNSMDPRKHALGVGWRWSYDSRLYEVNGAEIQVIQADGSRLRFVSSGGEPQRFQAQAPRRGHVQRLRSGQWRWAWPTGSELIFDKDGTLIRVLHPKQGIDLRIVWEQIGKAATPVIREVSTLKGLLGKLRFEYRIEGDSLRLQQVTTPSGVFEYAYDEHAFHPRLATVMRPDGMKRQYHYETPQQSGQANAITGITTWSADGMAHQRRQTWSYDKKGRAIAFEGEPAEGIRDRARLTYAATPSRDSVTRVFVERLTQDTGGRLLGRSFGAGRSWRWKYDIHGRVVSMLAQHGRHASETRIAWQSLRPVVIAHPQEKEIRSYDRRGQLRKRTLIRPAKGHLHPWIFKERFDHDQNGRRTRHALPEGGALRYHWDWDGRLKKLEWISEKGRHHEVIRAMPAGYRYGNGLYAVGTTGAHGLMDWMVYQPFLRIPLFRQQLLLNEAGGIDQEWVSAPPWKEHFSYGYDDRARLVAYRYRAFREGLPAGNANQHRNHQHKHQHQFHQQTAWLAWDPDGHAAGRWVDGHPSRPKPVLDGSGLPVQVGEFITEYGPDRRLQKVYRQTDPARVVTYGHNAFGEQIWRSQAGVRQHFLFDQHQRVAEVDDHEGDWRIRRRYLFVNQVPVAILDYQDGEPQLMFVHTDGIGLPRVVTDSKQQVRWRGRFTPFGRLIASEGMLDMPLRYPGQMADPFTGWHDNYQRTYDPDWGHYLETDPLGSVPGVAAWAYAGQQPRRYADPLGLMLFAFDGTRNRPESLTNVWLLGQAYRDGLVHYLSGPGDEDTMKSSDALWDAAIAWSGSQRVGLQWERLLQAVASHTHKASPMVVDVTGFSRGAALARDFAHRLATHVEDGRFWLNDPRRGVLTACMDLRFMGLFDTVAQFNPLGSGNAAFNLTISPKWKWAAHAVAAHERRWLFPLSAAKGSGNVVERPFVGAHADIGGGYLTAKASPGSTPGNLSNVALQWMAWQAQAAGVRLEMPSQSRLFDSPAIHDERSILGRRLQNGDRAVLYADGRKWVDYQAEHPEYGNALRQEVAAFIRDTPPSPTLIAQDVVGWVDMAQYAVWLRQRLGFVLER